MMDSEQGMTTVIIDPDSDSSVPVTGWVRPTKAETLAKGFPGDPDFVLYEGEPYVIWGDWGKGGCLFDEIQSLVEPTERRDMDVAAGLISHGRRCGKGARSVKLIPCCRFAEARRFPKLIFADL
jgi:hypothetical protein